MKRPTVEQLVGRSPLQTIAVNQLAAIYAHPRKEARALERRGLLHRIAHGYYCAVPREYEPEYWRPSTEAAAAAVATAMHGDRVPVLTGLSAARVHGALPRAIAVAYVAVPLARRPLRFVDRPGEIRFVHRQVADLDAVLITTDLGPALATSVEQTTLDLARLDPRAEDADHQEAIAALRPQCDLQVLEEIANRQRMRTTLTRVQRAG